MQNLAQSPGAAETRCYRLHPDLQLLAVAQMPQDVKNQLFETEGLAQYSAVLVSRSGEQSIKALDRHTHDLLGSLGDPGPINAHQLSLLGARAGQFLERLVLDNILEYEDQGRFVSGANANFTQGITAQNWCDPLSQAAIEYGIAHSLNDSVRLSARIYFYNREPASPCLLDLYPDSGSMMHELQRDFRPLLFADNSDWFCRTSTPDNPGWLVFRRKSQNGEKSAPYKIYLSPESNGFMDFFHHAAPLLAGDQRVVRFKIGATAHGLSRPDKCVAYCKTLEDQAEVCNQLVHALGAWPAHGVPFTTPACETLLFSTGTDPLQHERVLPGYERPSWRLWITNQIANTLAPLKAQDIEPQRQIELLQRRLQLAGINPDGWTLREGSEHAFN